MIIRELSLVVPTSEHLLDSNHKIIVVTEAMLYLKSLQDLLVHHNFHNFLKEEVDFDQIVFPENTFKETFDLDYILTLPVYNFCHYYRVNCFLNETASYFVDSHSFVFNCLGDSYFFTVISNNFFFNFVIIASFSY